MIDKFVYLILIGILIYIYISLYKDLKNKYYHKNLQDPTLGTGRFFFIALIFPKNYFKKETILEGWITYFINIIIIFCIVYILTKLFNLI